MNYENQEIKVSVYCTAYNHEAYISKTLEGFVNQKTRFKYEVIVHDDASTDNTKKIIKEYANRYPDIIVPIFQEANQYSKGFDIFKTYIFPIVRGKYIAVCEGDDYWCDRYKLQKQVDFLDAHVEYSACVHNSVREDLLKNEITIFNKSLEEYDLQVENVMSRGGSDYHTSSLMYKYEYAMEINSDIRPEFFDKPKRIGDYPLGIFLALKGKIRYFPDIMSVYRYGTPGSWSNNARNVKYFIETEYSLIDMLESVDKYTNGKYHSLIDKMIEKRYTKILNLETSWCVLKNQAMLRYFKNQTFMRKCRIMIKLLFINKFLYYGK